MRRTKSTSEGREVEAQRSPTHLFDDVQHVRENENTLLYSRAKNQKQNRDEQDNCDTDALVQVPKFIIALAFCSSSLVLAALCYSLLSHHLLLLFRFTWTNSARGFVCCCLGG